MKNKIKSALLGVAVGDALGVPVEFKNRKTISENPVTDMIGYGTYSQPAGTWSDDSSLTFCLAEALTQDFSYHLIGEYFSKWYHEKFWTARGDVFDIGNTTFRAIAKIDSGVRAEIAGDDDELSNGNGSLMRIIPLLFYIINKPIDERFELTRNVSSITHAHIRSVIACFYYLEFARKLIDGIDKFQIYKELQVEIPNYLLSISISQDEIRKFGRILTDNIYELPEPEIHSSGYVLHSLEASLWCLLTTNSYEDAVLKAVNLGSDSDTTAAITGGLAGLIYAYEGIPQRWIEQIARKEDIIDLSERLATKILEQDK